MITIELMEVLLIILALAGLVVLVFFALVLKIQFLSPRE